jgi:hypothetical protein
VGDSIIDRLKPAQLKELQDISSMIARGESVDALAGGWEKIAKDKALFAESITTGEVPADIMALVQFVLRQAYLETNKDLQYHAQKVKHYNEMKKQIRDELARVRKTCGDYISALEENLSSVGEDAQLANIDMQNMLQKQQQTIQMMSQISKTMHDTAMAVIRKIG